MRRRGVRLGATASVTAALGLVLQGSGEREAANVFMSA